MPRFSLLPYSMRNTKQPTPGAMRYALVTEMLPAFPIIGPGIGIVPLNVLQPGQIPWAHAVTPAGLGGLVAGQVVLQPLWDNSILAD